MDRSEQLVLQEVVCSASCTKPSCTASLQVCQTASLRVLSGEQQGLSTRLYANLARAISRRGSACINKVTQRYHDLDASCMTTGKRKLEENGMPTHVMISCFDEVDRLVEVDTRLLEPFNCRLYRMIKHDPPHVDHIGRRFW